MTRARRGLVALAATIMTIGTLLGCTGLPVEPSPLLATAVPVTAEETCSQLGDVLTIVHNARVSFTEGRSIRQEYDGALRLASRVLARVPAREGTKLADAVNAIKLISPAGPTGAMQPPFDPDSAEWSSARYALAPACAAEGVDLAVSAWTGG